MPELLLSSNTPVRFPDQLAQPLILQAGTRIQIDPAALGLALTAAIRIQDGPYAGRKAYVGVGEVEHDLNPFYPGSLAERWCAHQLQHIDSPAFARDLKLGILRAQLQCKVDPGAMTLAMGAAVQAFPYTGVHQDGLEGIQLTLRDKPLLLARFYDGTSRGLMPPIALKGESSSNAPSNPQPKEMSGLMKSIMMESSLPQNPFARTSTSSHGGLMKSVMSSRSLSSVGAVSSMSSTSSMSSIPSHPPRLLKGLSSSPSTASQHEQGMKENSPFVSTSFDLPALFSTTGKSVQVILFGSVVPLTGIGQATHFGLFLVPAGKWSITWTGLEAKIEREVLYSGMALEDCQLLKLDNPFLPSGKYGASKPVVRRT